MLFRGLGLLACLAGLVSAALPQTPDVDPFYVPPAGFESAPPGTVFRSRTIVPAFIGLLPDPIDAYQVLYRTTSVNGSAIATVTTIFRPSAAHNDRFVSFATAEDSSYIKCSPSYNYQLLAAQTDAIVSFEFLVIQVYLAAGYIVSSPDYEGPDAAFGPGHLAGQAVLDSMRAVNNFAETLNLTSQDNAIVGVGYSGGAIATGWAASLHPTYAPELNLKGWAAGGTPANLTGTMLFTDGTTFSGFLPAAVVGLSAPSAYGAQLRPVIDRIVTAKGQSALDFASENCAPLDIVEFAGQSILSYDFQSLGPNLPYEPTIASVLLDNTMGLKKNETPSAPVYLYHASQDEIIPYANATTLYDHWCSDGADVQFTTFAAGGHLTTEIYGVPSVVSFIESAFNGTVPKTCSKSTVLSNILDPLALGADLEPILLGLINSLLVLGEADNGNTSALQQPVPT